QRVEQSQSANNRKVQLPDEIRTSNSIGCQAPRGICVSCDVDVLMNFPSGGAQISLPPDGFVLLANLGAPFAPLERGAFS
ncbi:MAG: hypothetical protein ACTSWM_01070, partial [Alphaproteobacteria bacterium]